MEWHTGQFGSSVCGLVVNLASFGCQPRFLFFLLNFIYLFICLFLASLHGMQDLSSLTRDRTHATCSGSAGSLPLECRGIPPASASVARSVLSRLCCHPAVLHGASLNCTAPSGSQGLLQGSEEGWRFTSRDIISVLASQASSMFIIRPSPPSLQSSAPKSLLSEIKVMLGKWF